MRACIVTGGKQEMSDAFSNRRSRGMKSLSFWPRIKGFSEMSDLAVFAVGALITSSLAGCATLGMEPDPTDQTSGASAIITVVSSEREQEVDDLSPDSEQTQSRQPNNQHDYSLECKSTNLGALDKNPCPDPTLRCFIHRITPFSII